ncbi:mediator of RNA polymerase II transcription subunit 6-like protein [Trifolium pratense]|uniref:Mediator of RNA polymerase II transcription subunit 6-like protein n=1 Tax=Trifolium pratense TaxID=57577 RepID=A0A2K3L5Z0_TRIPR|nr:mediator of RNA polymerase II transcription subunit 6-like protein [Trifolium pratense]
MHHGRNPCGGLHGQPCEICQATVFLGSPVEIQPPISTMVLPGPTFDNTGVTFPSDFSHEFPYILFDSENETTIPEPKAAKETIDLKEIKRVDHILASLQRKNTMNSCYHFLPCLTSSFPVVAALL